MTEHPTSHESRRSASTAAPSASPARGPGGTAPLGAVPDPRSALQQPAAAGFSPVPGSGFAVRGGDDLGLSGVAVTASAGPPAGRAGHADDEPAADHGAARDDAAIPYGEAYGDPYGGDSYGEVAMPASGRPGGVPDAGRETARAGRRGAQGAVGRAEAPEPGDEPHRGQRPRHGGGGAGRPWEEGDERARDEGIGRPREGGGDRVPAPAGGADSLPSAPLPPVPPARSAHPGESGEVAAARQAGGDRLRFIGAATRRIARGIDLDEIVLGLCRATVPTFADAILVYLRDPLPVGDERPTGPVVLRLRRTDRIPEEPDTNGARLPVLPAQPDLGPAMGGSAAELAEVRPGGPLAEVLRGCARCSARRRRRVRRCPSCWDPIRGCPAATG